MRLRRRTAIASALTSVILCGASATAQTTQTTAPASTDATRPVSGAVSAEPAPPVEAPVEPARAAPVQLDPAALIPGHGMVTEATHPLGVLEHPAGPMARRREARRPYHLDLALDLSVLLAGASLWVPPEYMLREFVPLGRCPCDPTQLNELDRRTAGVSVPGFGDASNIAQVALLTLPAVVDMFDVWRSGGGIPEWFEDTIVLGESLVVGGALNEVAKLIFQRPRPQAYGIDPGDGRLGDPDTYLSFYSLSAAEVFTAGIAGAVTYALRHPRGPWRWVYLAAAGTLATGFGVTRFLIGRHFPTDVITAGVLGTVVGIVVPWLHQRPINLSLGAQVAPGAALITVSGATP